MMRTGDLLESNSPVGLLGSSSVATAALSVPPLDLSAYSQIVQHVASLYRCDPTAVAASLASLTSSAGHLPLALTAPHAFSSSITAGLGSVSTAELSVVKTDNTTYNQVKKNGYHHNSEVESSKSSQAQKYQTSYQNIYEKPRRSKSANNSKVQNIPQDNDGALDLSTQGLRSLYSSYRRITLDKLKPKVVEDFWVENDSELSWTNSKVAAYNPAQKLFMCVDCECVGFLSRVAEHWLGAHANLRVFRCPRCPYTSAWSRCVKMHLTRQHNEQCADTTMWKENATLMEVTRLMQELRTKVENRIDSSNTLSDKRFYCPHCPYATDRRDLYTRHENIHKDDKPFHCYLCFKQFNRADHVKKHFVRMHPDTPYDIAKIRKQPGVRGRGSPLVHEPTPPPSGNNNQISTHLSHSSTSLLTPPMSLEAATSRQRSTSPLPLTIQNLRVHNLAMNNFHPPSPPSPEITVDVVTPDPPVNVSMPSPPTTDILSQIQTSNHQQTNSVTITKCSPPQSPQPIVISSPNIPLKFAQVTPLMPQNLGSVVKHSETTKSLHVSSIDSTEGGKGKKGKTDRAFRCPYCQWTGSDNWCLKRHMNTHIKPFACTMCEYKAARAERLSTHVLKVHNKRICNKCNFMAETQEKLLEHTREEHHNNPYSRRHTCGICGLTLENQTSLQNHLQKMHSPKPKPPASPPTALVPITQTSISPPQNEAQDLTTSSNDQTQESSLQLVCPVEKCPRRFDDSTFLSTHLEKQHEGDGLAQCPHCSYCLTKDELAKDHWLTHHQDVCPACVLVFTSVYGAQMWKKVHVKPTTQETSLDVIVSGLCRKRSAPSSLNDSMSSDSEQCDSASMDSDHHDSDYERQCKRSRKQSCPKKVVPMSVEDQADGDNEQELDDDQESNYDSSSENKKGDMKRKKNRRCLLCPHKPLFATYSRLRMHHRNRHRTSKQSNDEILSNTDKQQPEQPTED